MPRLSSESTLTPSTLAIGLLAVLLFTMTYTLFDQATWFFAFHYYNCQAKLSYLERNQLVPVHFDRNQNCLFYAGVLINTIVPVSYGIVNAVTTYRYYRVETTHKYPWALVGNFLLQGLVQLFSYVFLAIGLWRIRRFLQNSAFKDHINNGMMTAHLVCFTVYILGGMILQVAVNYLYLTHTSTAQRVTLCLMIVCLFFDFAASLTLAFIFSRIGQAEVTIQRRE